MLDDIGKFIMGRRFLTTEATPKKDYRVGTISVVNTALVELEEVKNLYNYFWILDKGGENMTMKLFGVLAVAGILLGACGQSPETDSKQSG